MRVMATLHLVMAIVAVFGATGRAGLRVCEHARAAGHALRVLVRDPSKLGSAHADAQVITGDVLNTAAVDALVAGADAIISALGADDFKAPGNTLSQGMLNIVAAAQTHGVRRVLAVAGGGVLDAPGGGVQSEQPGFPAVFSSITKQHHGTWRALRESGLDWTLACTPDLTEGEGTGEFRAEADVMPAGGESIARDDVARWLVDQIARTEFVGKRVGLAT